MTTITGTITGSTGVPLDGTLTFVLLSPVVDDTTDPDTVRFPVEESFTVTGGVVNITIPESETEDTPYRITFIETGETTALLDANRIVPNVAGVDFSTFMESGLTASNLDTGVLRIAREIGKDPALLALLRSPTMFEVTLLAQATEQIIYVPKPFVGPARLANFAALIVQNPDFWSFEVGAVDAQGNDSAAYAPIDTNEAAATSGRKRVILTYDQIIPADSLGAYLKASPGAGAAPLTATLAAGFTEI